ERRAVVPILEEQVGVEMRVDVRGGAPVESPVEHAVTRARVDVDRPALLRAHDRESLEPEPLAVQRQAEWTLAATQPPAATGGAAVAALARQPDGRTLRRGPLDQA